jgi:hypothetical protein
MVRSVVGLILNILILDRFEERVMVELYIRVKALILALVMNDSDGDGMA